MIKGKPQSSTAERIGTLEGAGLVALGAMAGAGIRAGIGLLPLPKDDVPVGTLIVNLTGAFLLGLLYAVLDQLELAAARRHDGSGSRTRMVLRLLLGTGVMGGLTTYSTFLLEVDTRLGQGRVGLALVYGIGSILVGWLAVFLGDLLGRAVLKGTVERATQEASSHPSDREAGEIAADIDAADIAVDPESQTAIDTADAQEAEESEAAQGSEDAGDVDDVAASGKSIAASDRPEAASGNAAASDGTVASSKGGAR